MAIEERGYQQQVGPARAAALPMADANAFGADVGRAIGRVGDSVHRSEISAYQIERQQKADQEAADFNSRFAQARERMDKLSVDLRNSAGPGAAGHAKAIADAWEAESGQLLQGLSETRLINSAREQLTQFGGRLRSSEYEFEQGARVGKLVADQKTATDVAANRASQVQDPQKYAEEIRIGREGIDALVGVPDNVKQELIQHHEQAVSIGYLNGLNNSNPRAAIALIDSGAFNELLTQQQLDQARNGAQVEIRRADAAAAHQQALQTQALKDEVETVNAQISAGVEIPDGRLADLQNRLTAIGDMGGATKIGVTRIEAGVRREADVWRPEQYDAEINRLEAKGKRTPDEDIRLKTLRGMRGTAVSTFNNNPGEWAAKNGFAPPAIDVTDASTFRARAAWARTVTRQTGRITPIFNDAEVRQLRDEASVSQQGMVDVANRIAVVGGLQARQAAKQVLPNDPMLARMVSIDGDSRAAALRGAALRKANKAIVDGQGSQEVASHFYDILGAAAQSFDAQEVGAALDVAKSLYADAKKGHSEWATDGKPEDLNPYINIALGGKKGADGFWRGGLGHWNDVPMLLPDNWTQGAFDRVLSQVRFKPDSKTGPVWADGKPMSAVDLRKYVPVRRADGRYEFHDTKGGTVARQRNGQIYALDVEAVGRGLGIVTRRVQ
jgi:hypothetical protein